MPDPLIPFSETYVEGSAWQPHDFNAITLATQRFQDAFELKHDANGFHVRDPRMPLEAAICVWSGAAYSITESTTDSTLAIGAHPGTGYVTMSLGAMPNTDYRFTVDPFPTGTEKLYFYEDGTFAKTTTAFQFAMFNNAGAYVDRSFLVLVYGSRS